jgi:hypothetical protein
MASIINASTSGAGGVITTADASGVLELQSAGTTMATISPSGFNLGSGTPSAQTALSPYTGFKNKIINGAMQVYQRGTTATNPGTTGSGSAYCTVDRYQIYRAGAVAGLISSVGLSGGPTGFPQFTRVERAAGNTATNIIFIGQAIESINCSDLPNQTVTLSFWARAGANYSSASNLLNPGIVSGTGTDGSIYNGFTGSTSVANTNVTLTTSWQQFTLSGTVPSNSAQVGIQIAYTPTGTAGAADYFDITGIQLEVGTSATSFEYRSIGQELALCERYGQQVSFNIYIGNTAGGFFWSNAINFQTSMRAAPTFGSLTGGGTANILSESIESITAQGCRITIQASGNNANAIGRTAFASAEL